MQKLIFLVGASYAIQVKNQMLVQLDDEDIDLDQEFVVLAALGELLCLIQGFVLLAAYFDRSVDIEDRFSLVLALGPLYELCYFVLLFQFYVAI